MSNPPFATVKAALEAVLARLEVAERIYRRKAEDPKLSDPSARGEWWAKISGLGPVKNTVAAWLDATATASRSERDTSGPVDG